MNAINDFISQLPIYLISLPVVLFSLSVHECCHGYAALRLGDPTARNLGRLTLNPLKHIDPIGFICMVLFHFGWANPVPINTRQFKNPRRDMALSALAGPISNILLAFLFGAALRASLWVSTEFFMDDLNAVAAVLTGSAAGFDVSRGFIIMAILIVMLYLGVTINFSYAIFNLIPVPPLDGSRIFYVFLPTKWYFGIMKYERVIMLGMLALLWFGLLDAPLSWAVGGLEDLVFGLYGIRYGNEPFAAFYCIQYYVTSFI